MADRRWGLARDAGLGIAWLIGAACGWRVAQQADLLEAVLRGAGAGLAVLLLWMAGVAVCSRLIRAGDRRGDEHD